MTGKLVLGLVAAGSAAVLAASGSGAPAGGVRATPAHGIPVALALGGSRVAFSNGAGVVVWNVGAGTTTKLSTHSDAHLAELAITGSQVAWHTNATSNLESDDYVFASSVVSPRPRLIAKAVRSGGRCGAARGGRTPACAGTWLGGVVGAGNRILVNRWTTDTAGAIAHGGLYALAGKRLKPVASGAGTVRAIAADAKTVAVLQWRWLRPEKTVRVYSSSGTLLWSAKPKVWPPLGVAVSGRNLVVLELNGTLALYDARTGVLRKTFSLHAKELSKDRRPPGNPMWLQALAVQGNIAVYSAPVRYTKRGDPRVSAIHAVNLSTGKNRVVAQSPGQIPLARMDSAGLVYATVSYGYAPNRVVFVPLGRIAPAVS